MVQEHGAGEPVGKLCKSRLTWEKRDPSSEPPNGNVEKPSGPVAGAGGGLQDRSGLRPRKVSKREKWFLWLELKYIQLKWKNHEMHVSHWFVKTSVILSTNISHPYMLLKAAICVVFVIFPFLACSEYSGKPIQKCLLQWRGGDRASFPQVLKRLS